MRRTGFLLASFVAVYAGAAACSSASSGPSDGTPSVASAAPSPTTSSGNPSAQEGGTGALLGETCAAGCAGTDRCFIASSTCASGLCLFDRDQAYCTERCDRTCPSGYACESRPDLTSARGASTSVCARVALADGCAAGWCRQAVENNTRLRSVGGAVFAISGGFDTTARAGTARVQRLSDDGKTLTNVGQAIAGTIRDLGGVDGDHLVGVGSELGTARRYRFENGTWTSEAILRAETLGGGPLRFASAVYAPNAAETFLLTDDEFVTPHRFTTDGADAPSNVGTDGALFGFASDDVWALGSSSYDLHWTGAAWETVMRSPDAPPCALGTTFGGHRAVCFDSDMKRMKTFDGTSWQNSTSPLPPQSRALTVAVARRGSGYVAVGAPIDGSLLTSDGASVTRVSFGDPSMTPTGVAALPDGRIVVSAYAVEAGRVGRYYLYVQAR